MKKLLLIVLLFFSLRGLAQTFPINQNLGAPNTTVVSKGNTSSATGFTWPLDYIDTTTANTALYVSSTPGIVIRTGTSFWVRNNTVNLWVALGGGGSDLADQGLIKSGSSVQLGQLVGAIGNPAAISAAREVPLDTNSFYFFNQSVANSGKIQIRGGDAVTHAPEVNFLQGGSIKFRCATGAAGGFQWDYNGTFEVGTGIHVVGSTLSHFFIADVRNGINYASIETNNGSSTANFGTSLINDITQFGLKGKVVFGSALSHDQINGDVDNVGSTYLRDSLMYVKKMFITDTTGYDIMMVARASPYEVKTMTAADFIAAAGGSGSATGWDDMLAVGQAQTATRSVDLNGNIFAIQNGFDNFISYISSDKNAQVGSTNAFVQTDEDDQEVIIGGNHKVKIQDASLGAASVGDVWTLTNGSGEGHWATPTGGATGWDDMLAVAQAQTATRTIDVNSRELDINGTSGQLVAQWANGGNTSGLVLLAGQAQISTNSNIINASNSGSFMNADDGAQTSSIGLVGTTNIVTTSNGQGLTYFRNYGSTELVNLSLVHKRYVDSLISIASANTSVGSGYSVAINNTSNIKSLANRYGLVLDSATSNQIGFSVDSTKFPDKTQPNVISGMWKYANGVKLVGGFSGTPTGDGLEMDWTSGTNTYNLVVYRRSVSAYGNLSVASLTTLFATGASGTNTMLLSGGQVFIGGSTTPTATLMIAAGTTGEVPLKLVTGPVATVPEAGAFEYTTPQVFFTNGALVRQELFQGQQSRVSTQFDKTNETLANITGLTANVAAGKTYRFRAELYTTSDVAGGIQVAIAGTATATAIVYDGFTIDAGLTTQGRGTALATAVAAVTGVTAAHVTITGTITVNAAGTLTVQSARNAATGTTSVLVGSTFVIYEML